MNDKVPGRAVRGFPHMPPEWVDRDAVYFITINCRSRGQNQLTSDATSKAIMETVRSYHDLRRWWPMLVVLMPDHLHALVSFSWEKNQGMSRVISDWKRYVSRHHGVSWQRDYCDHRIRSDQDLQSTWRYIRGNPVRGGLVQSHEEWPHVWRPSGIGWQADDG